MRGIDGAHNRRELFLPLEIKKKLVPSGQPDDAGVTIAGKRSKVMARRAVAVD
ncbi:MAG: hypothetical protein ABI167_00860 [Nitrosospira sp.]